MLLRTTPTVLCLLLATPLLATHNFSGEIVFQKTGGLGLTAYVITYTRASSVNADRDSLVLDWGDGQQQTVHRINGVGQEGELVGDDIKKNIYLGAHLYAAEGIYRLSMTDPNRVAGIINLNAPASDNIPFHLEAMVRLLPDAAASVYSPVFLEPPVDEAALYQPFEHVPNGFDADGDSLAYRLVMPLQATDQIVPNYYWPDQILPGPQNHLSIDSLTGKITWNAPQVSGPYCLALIVRAYRNGVLMEEIRRDMLIDVSEQFNVPPTLVLTPEVAETEVLEVNVGQTVQFQVDASDTDTAQTLSVSASSGLLEDFFQQKATFTASGSTAVFSWAVTNEHVREQPYQVVFKAKDDFEDEGLATMRVLRLHVNAVSGVAAASKLPQIRLFPNPSPDFVNVEIPNLPVSGLRLRIVDLAGQSFLEQAVRPGEKFERVETGSLSAGLYVLQLLQGNTLLAKEKFVIEK